MPVLSARKLFWETFMGDSLIGMFDILGFKALIESTPLDELIARTGRFLSLTDGILSIPGDGLGREKLAVRVVQDTVIVTSKDTGDADLKRILEYSAALMGFAFLDGILLRGAMTLGEAHVDPNMVIGKGIVRAYQMEQSQEWVGCWIDEKCTEGRPDAVVAELAKYVMLRYPVPMKTGPRKEHWALNWTVSVSSLPEKLFDKAYRREWDKTCGEKSTWDARRKLEQTDRFCGEVMRQGMRAAFEAKQAQKK